MTATTNGNEKEPEVVRLADYTPPPFLVDEIALEFDLDPERTRVRSTMRVRRNRLGEGGEGDLRLDGVGLELARITIDGEALDPAGQPGRLLREASRLELRGVPDAFELHTESFVNPSANSSLEGLYLSGDIYCTQCEAEGFRKITWFPDRPDVMSRYTVTVNADAARCPVLLSNGNPVAGAALGDGRHFVRWEDPFAKPSYLFALVAGPLERVEDTFTTQSGREVSLRIYVEAHNVDRCAHAMSALKKAMRWDEERFGLEYDLDIYMIVAVDDFNMGAMENKGLNVFNSKYVLARPDTATDADYAAIEGVVAHEYFHNWTGNRVTCRDWFQLSLKEGLTVFRDQEFSADVTARSVKRIQDVRTLRTYQFPEDAGPMAHPVRPESYVEISNFYTVTVYNKGAEVIRMMHTLIGERAFRRGMDVYFERHDGEAVTIEDFVRAMEAASEELARAGGAPAVDLEQFRRWYAQGGTPTVEVASSYDAASRRLRLDCAQRCPPTPGQSDKAPFHIPLRIALLDAAGVPLVLSSASAGARLAPGAREAVLELREAEQRFEFDGVPERPVYSLARGFSAPVHIRSDRTRGELAFLAANDDDDFNRWDAVQEYAAGALLERIEGAAPPVQAPRELAAALGELLADPGADAGLVAETLKLPAENYLAERVDIVDPEQIHEARQGLQRELAAALEGALVRRYRAAATNEPYRFGAEAAGRRSLRNACLALLMTLEREDLIELSHAQFTAADNMTDQLAALGTLAQVDCTQRAAALRAFEARWQDDPLVLDKWFTLQATSRLPDTLECVRRLLEHPRFDRRNPNRVRSLIGAFVHGNPLRFHSGDGAGYSFLADQVVDLDRSNPQVAARLLGAFSRWRRFDAGRQALMRSELERMLSTPHLSRDSYEIASKTLA